MASGNQNSTGTPGNTPADSYGVIWLTGIPGSGKTTLGQGIAAELENAGSRVVVLDGDELRKTVSHDLGFSDEDRTEHSRRVVELCKQHCRDGLTIIVCLISPTRAIRDAARTEITRFIEVWVKCSMEECIRRDPKGLYAKALRGEITNLTGLQDVYEEPNAPEVLVDTEAVTVAEGVNLILQTVQTTV